MSDTLSVSREDLQVLFDTAVGSLEFGSGMLDDPEVVVLRRVAVILGVAPTIATPHNFAAKYPHPFVPRLRRYSRQSDECAHCFKSGSHEVHSTA